MWNSIRQNRIVDERERTREHQLHVERLRKVKASIDMKKPRKPSFLRQNYKKELQTLEKKNDIQFENRLLLKKMLQIDLKPSNLNKNLLMQNDKLNKTQNSSAGILHVTSLNRKIRIRDMAKIIEDNKVMLKKLQDANSHYNTQQWEKENKRKNKILSMLSKNSDRYCKNPYFLHSMATSDHTYYMTAPYPDYRSTTTKKKLSMGTLEVNQSLANVKGTIESTKRLKKLRPMSAPKYGASRRTITGINKEMNIARYSRDATLDQLRENQHLLLSSAEMNHYENNLNNIEENEIENTKGNESINLEIQSHQNNVILTDDN